MQVAEARDLGPSPRSRRGPEPEHHTRRETRDATYSWKVHLLTLLLLRVAEAKAGNDSTSESSGCHGLCRLWMLYNIVLEVVLMLWELSLKG